MKSLLIAGALLAAATGVAQAFPVVPADKGLASSEQAEVVKVYWMSRYGKRCYHGPVWIPACHATNRPVGYMRGHWNATGSRFIPGRYY